MHEVSRPLWGQKVLAPPIGFRGDDMSEKDSEHGSRYGPELPKELANAVWLIEDGIETAKGRHLEFQEGGVYQIGHGASPKALLVYLRDEGIHHAYKSYKASWLTTFTDAQLCGIEVMKMASDIKSCPHCGGKLLKVNVSKEAENGQFFGRVICQNKGCGAITGWRIVLSKDSAKSDGESLTPEEKSARLEAAAREILIAAWNRRT